MILVLDIGNTQIFGGVFEGEKIKLRFRTTSKGAITSDELGIFLKQVIRENNITPLDIKQIAFASVVPDLNRTIVNCCLKYFGKEPFVVSAAINSGITFNHTDAAVTLGADRVANIIAARHLYPETNLIIIDFGTANTYCAVSKKGEYKGGAIQVGISVSLNALTENAAQLFKVEILDPGHAAGITTETQMQSGMYYGNLGAIKEFVSRLKEECFPNEEVKVIATGGLARMFEKEPILDLYHPDLVLIGIKLAATGKL